MAFLQGRVPRNPVAVAAANMRAIQEARAEVPRMSPEQYLNLVNRGSNQS